jgi:hypothetical protein
MLLINLYISVDVKECINLHTLLTTFKSINTVYLTTKQKRPKALTLSFSYRTAHLIIEPEFNGSHSRLGKS